MDNALILEIWNNYKIFRKQRKLSKRKRRTPNKNAWGNDEIEKLRKEFFDNKLEIKEIAQLHNRTIPAILAKLSKLKFKRNKNVSEFKPWDKNEVEQLKQEYVFEKKNMQTIALIHKRTINDVRKKCIKLRLCSELNAENLSSFWFEDEIEQLKREYLIDKKDFKTIAQIHKRTINSVQSKIYSLKLNCENDNYKKWTCYETKILNEELLLYDIKTIAKKHNRTISSIENKIFILKNKKRIKLTTQNNNGVENDNVLENDNSENNNSISEINNSISENKNSDKFYEYIFQDNTFNNNLNNNILDNDNLNNNILDNDILDNNIFFDYDDSDNNFFKKYLNNTIHVAFPQY